MSEQKEQLNKVFLVVEEDDTDSSEIFLSEKAAQAYILTPQYVRKFSRGEDWPPEWGTVNQLTEQGVKQLLQCSGWKVIEKEIITKTHPSDGQPGLTV